MSARLATTVLLLRGGQTHLEVFMVQRHRKSGFLPNAWVFPGGRVDDADRLAGHRSLIGGQQVLGQLNIPHEDAIAHVVAGVRETWEEVGIWLGDGAPDPTLRQSVATGQRPLISVLSENSAMHLDALRAWSWWVTPVVEPRRYDTRFLVAMAEDAEGRHDEHETVDSRWVRPQEILASPDHVGFPLAPPTWWTLAELAEHACADAAFAAAASRIQRPIQPVMKFADEGMSLLMPGHEDHPDAAISGVPQCIAFEDGQWVAKH